jgi:hypothetical protein
MSWIYVAGPFRSGSTVIGDRLAGMSGGVHIGESHHVWQSLIENELCSCGSNAADCPFWVVVADVLDELGCNDLREALRLRHEVASTRGLFPPWRTVARQRYQNCIDGLVNAVSVAAAGRTVVDTGKLAASLPYLERATTSLRVLYLYRDGIAVVNSWRHAKPDPSKPGGAMKTKTTTRAVVDLVRTQLAHLVVRPQAPIASLRYEAFAAQPELSISSTLGVLGVDIAHNVSGESHVLAGNPTRFDQRASARIVFDQKYRAELTGLHGAAVRAGTMPANLAFRLLERRVAAP